MTAAHEQTVTHRYTVRYPEHSARTDDPHYRDFDHLHRTLKADPQRWRCDVGARRDDFSECDLTRPLELHHAHIEFALTNAVDLAWLAATYPGVDTPDELGAWVESADNLEVLCVRHHRGDLGVHSLTASDYEAARFVRDLIA